MSHMLLKPMLLDLLNTTIAIAQRKPYHEEE